MAAETIKKPGSKDCIDFERFVLDCHESDGKSLDDPDEVAFIVRRKLIVKFYRLCMNDFDKAVLEKYLINHGYGEKDQQFCEGDWEKIQEIHDLIVGGFCPTPKY